MEKKKSLVKNRIFDLPPNKDQYKIIDFVGSGGYGTVCKANTQNSSNLVAIKRIDNLENRLVTTRTLREIKFLSKLSKLKHENVNPIFF